MELIKRYHLSTQALIITIIYLIPFTFSNDSNPIPPTPGQLEQWFQQNVQPISARKSTVDPALNTAESNAKIIKVGSEFKTIQAAIDSIPAGNTNRYIISIPPGNYNEKVKIDRGKPFITLYGADPKNLPVVTYAGTAAKYGTFYSATVTCDADYFSAVNIKFVNSAPRPPPGAKNAQAVAMRIGGDKASFYNCMFMGFQDTLCDDQGRHFYKDCHIQGTIDFIFGAGKSLYVNCVIHIDPGDVIAVVTAQGAPSKIANSGYSFVHCQITGGKVGTGLLGRAWRKDPQVVFSYSLLGDAVDPVGWSNNLNPSYDSTVFYGEFKNSGPRADLNGRYKYVKKFTDDQAKPFLCLSHIMGSKWLLPPAKV